MALRTPLGAVRGQGSARSGTRHFWRQRLTAIANVPLTIGFVLLVVANLGGDYEAVRGALSSPLAALVLLAFVLSGVYHMRLGLQVIIEDYVHGEGLKFACLIANTLFSAALALICLFAILKLAVGG